MKLSADTIKILKNYSDINSNIIFNPGNKLATKNEPPTIISEAIVSENFEKKFGIYDLKEFLSILAMFSNPSLEFSDDYVTITDDDDPTIKTKYWRTAESNLTTVPVLKKLPDPQASWKLSAINLQRIEKSSAILKSPDVVFEGNKETRKITARVCNLKNGQNNNDFLQVLDENYEGENFSVHLTQSKFIIINADYKVDLIADKLIRLTCETMPLTYYITKDIDSY